MSDVVPDLVELRPMQRSDVQAVAALEAAVSPEPWSVGLLEGEFEVAPESRHWVVAEAVGDGSIVGFAGMMLVGTGDPGSGEGHVMNIAVHPDARRRGVATALCAALCDHAADVGFDALTLEVRVSNRPAIELYRRFGFAPVGTRRRYYTNVDGTKEDALIMWVHDNRVRRQRARTTTQRAGTTERGET